MRHAGRSNPYRRRLRADSNFWFELQFCDDAGIPHSYFLGAKRLRWTAKDRAKAIAFRTEKALRCTLCGSADWEWDPKQGGRRGAYEPVAHECLGCRAIALTQKATDPSVPMDGITFQLERTDTVQAAERVLRERRRGARESRARQRERAKPR